MAAATGDPRETGRAGSARTIDTPQALRLARWLERLERAGFYGKVTVSFQNGRVGDVKIEQTNKLDEL